MPQWLLTLSFWLHMVATIVWIGGLFYQAVFLVPAFNTTVEPALRISILELIRKRFSTAAWISLLILLATGMLQLIANPNYEGILNLTNRWSMAILLKHLAVVGMVIVASFQTWFIQPRLIQLMLIQKKRQDDSSLANLQNISNRLRLTTILNVLLGLIVLVFTAAARTA